MACASIASSAGNRYIIAITELRLRPLRGSSPTAIFLMGAYRPIRHAFCIASSPPNYCSVWSAHDDLPSHVLEQRGRTR